MKEQKLEAVFLANAVMIGKRQEDSLFANREQSHKYDLALIDGIKVRIRCPQQGAQVFTSLYNVKSWWEPLECSKKEAGADKEPKPKTQKKQSAVKL